MLLSKISPHFLQTDSPRGGIGDSRTHGCFPPTWYPGWPTPHPWARWQLCVKVPRVCHPPSLLDLPQWLCPWVLALGQPLQLGAPFRLVPSQRLTSPLGSMPEGLSSHPSLGRLQVPFWSNATTSAFPGRNLQDGEVPASLETSESKSFCGVALWNPRGKVSQVLHGLAFHPHDPGRGSASPTWRQGHGGQPEEDMPGVTTREFLWGQNSVWLPAETRSHWRDQDLTHPAQLSPAPGPGPADARTTHTCTESPDWCPQPHGMAVHKISTNMATTDLAVMLCQQWS